MQSPRLADEEPTPNSFRIDELKVQICFTHSFDLASELLTLAASMDPNNIVQLNVVREIRQAEKSNSSYEARIQKLEKLELLDEMMKFQESRSTMGHLTFEMMIQGQTLFRRIEEMAETLELKSLAHSYCRHLKFELDSRIKSRGSPKRKLR